MTHCVFCQAAAREIPAVFLLDDRLTTATVDPRQTHHGHVLVLPETRRKLRQPRQGDSRGARLVHGGVTRAASRAYQPEGQTSGSPTARPPAYAHTEEALARIGERIRREIV